MIGTLDDEPGYATDAVGVLVLILSDSGVQCIFMQNGLNVDVSTSQ
jgi:hypothetical protein